MTGQEFSEDVLLAAVDRAARHSSTDSEIAGSSAIRFHLGIDARSGAWRRVRGQLDGLAAAGLVEQSRYAGLAVWSVTAAGRKRLATIAVMLPESPQHQRWRKARTLAHSDLGPFRAELTDALREGLALLEGDAPARSDVWLALGKRLGRATERVAAATHCLGEWPEPDDVAAEVATDAELALRIVLLAYARTVTVARRVLRWTIDIKGDTALVVLTPVNALDARALEDVALGVERVFAEHIAAGASASANFKTGCIEVHIALDAITVTDISRKLWALERSDP